ncbi:MAG: hypothetical protein M3R36_14755 [Bacteroidota bacterium]|nr:hypothetical protein [Bacteroidota bacterium]
MSLRTKRNLCRNSKLYVFIIISLHIFFSNTNSFSQVSNDSFSKVITAEDYTITLKNNDENFFSGSINVKDKNDVTVCSADSIFTRYNWDTLIDLNNDGSKELIIDLATGATMYDYNMFLIFDFSKNSIVPFEIHNAGLISYLDPVPKIVTNVRLSPSALGAGYSFSLVYNNSKLVLESDVNASNVLRSLEQKDSEYLELIEEYKKLFDECGEDSEIYIYYESYVMQQKILGQEDKGWEFFDKYYKCKDKEKVKTELKRNVQDSYDFWNTSEFKFGS